MSSWRPGRLECAICHQANDVSLLLGTNSFGGVSDLDMRLGGMARNDMVARSSVAQVAAIVPRTSPSPRYPPGKSSGAPATSKSWMIRHSLNWLVRGWGGR